MTDPAYAQQLFDKIDDYHHDSICNGICIDVNLKCMLPGCCCGFCSPIQGIVTSIEVQVNLAYSYDINQYPENVSTITATDYCFLAVISLIVL